MSCVSQIKFTPTFIAQNCKNIVITTAFVRIDCPFSVAFTLIAEIDISID